MNADSMYNQLLNNGVANGVTIAQVVERHGHKADLAELVELLLLGNTDAAKSWAQYTLGQCVRREVGR